MTCPYCDSKKWTANYDKPMNFRYEYHYIVLSFECECKDCGKMFYEDCYYYDNNEPEYIPIEESE